MIIFSKEYLLVFKGLYSLLALFLIVEAKLSQQILIFISLILQICDILERDGLQNLILLKELFILFIVG